MFPRDDDLPLVSSSIWLEHLPRLERGKKMYQQGRVTKWVDMVGMAMFGQQFSRWSTRGVVRYAKKALALFTGSALFCPMA